LLLIEVFQKILAEIHQMMKVQQEKMQQVQKLAFDPAVHFIAQ
jgi:hypothetical protein